MYLNGWNAKPKIYVTHASSWKFISEGYTSFIQHLRYGVGDGYRIRFWENYWLGDNHYSLFFNRVYRISSLHDAPISNFLKRDGNSLSWDFHFFRNLTDLKSNEMESLLTLLDSVHLCTFSDKRIWILDSIGSFSCKS